MIGLAITLILMLVIGGLLFWVIDSAPFGNVLIKWAIKAIIVLIAVLILCDYLGVGNHYALIR